MLKLVLQTLFHLIVLPIYRSNLVIDQTAVKLRTVM